MAFTISVYVAILTGRRHADILALYETKEAAIDQCRAWIRTVPDIQPELVPIGHEWYCQYGTADETVRVEKRPLELADDEAENQSVYLPVSTRTRCLGDMPEITITAEEGN